MKFDIVAIFNGGMTCELANCYKDREIQALSYESAVNIAEQMQNIDDKAARQTAEKIAKDGEDLKKYEYEIANFAPAYASNIKIAGSIADIEEMALCLIYEIEQYTEDKESILNSLSDGEFLQYAAALCGPYTEEEKTAAVELAYSIVEKR